MAEREARPRGEQYRVPGQPVQCAQQVLDVVKVERPVDPRTLALAVAQAIEGRDRVSMEELRAAVELVADRIPGPLAPREGRRRGWWWP